MPELPEFLTDFETFDPNTQLVDNFLSGATTGAVIALIVFFFVFKNLSAKKLLVRAKEALEASSLAVLSFIAVFLGSFLTGSGFLVLGSVVIAIIALTIVGRKAKTVG